jgi:starch phosphorylase
MKPIHTFLQTPSLPASIERFRDCVYNLRWAWNHSTLSLFRRLDSDLWETSAHNPVLMLGTVEQSKLEAAANDEGFLSHLKGVTAYLDQYMENKATWFNRTSPIQGNPLVAYFSAEFGVTECLSVFAGGLGVLAGDHLKSASDLGIPLVGIGLLYQQGYFHQYLNESGWQQEAYEDNDFHNLPLFLQKDSDGNPLLVSVDLPDRKVYAQIWRAQVGRVPLYLLDTNIEKNNPIDRDITDQLYGGDKENRIKQEVLLGIGGYRALGVLGLNPIIYHMNEGHSSFLAIEHIRTLMGTYQLSFSEAREAASASLIFTTHTAVAAGQDYFPPELIDRYLGSYYQSLGISRYEFLAQGRQNPGNETEAFCMTVLALRMASYSNAVSKLHGEVSRQMWQGLWPNLPKNEIPIRHVTNGVHFSTWLSQEMDQLYERYLGDRWKNEPVEPFVWQRADRIPAEELWRTHERRRERLVAFARRRLLKQLQDRGVSPSDLAIANEVLNPEALTIGFARRFATYKRAALLFHDPERLARILSNPDRPVQIIFAGKAHPQDNPGKELIRKILQFAAQEPFRRHIVFLENYDMTIARYMVQGSDVWLNTPLRPQEASGTSGIKAAANGVLNLSTLDGWWDEAYTPEIGWSIGRGETYDNEEHQATVEAEALYELLEQDVIPTFYDRGSDHLPRRWIARMKASIQKLCYYFNTHRMVGEYTQSTYLPAAQHTLQLFENNMERTRRLSEWKQKLSAGWANISIGNIQTSLPHEITMGDSYSVNADIRLGSLTPEDVSVELYLGPVNSEGQIITPRCLPMTCQTAAENGVYRYEVTVDACCNSGLHGFTIRVLPRHPDLVTPYLPGLIVWK